MKLQDFSLINKMLLKSSICMEWRYPKSKLQVYQYNLERNGLAESLFVLCSHCSYKTPFYSSKKLPGRKIPSAATSRAELVRFCARFHLPLPVTKRLYNSHMEKNCRESHHSCWAKNEGIWCSITYFGSKRWSGKYVCQWKCGVNCKCSCFCWWDMAEVRAHFKDWSCFCLASYNRWSSPLWGTFSCLSCLYCPK